MITLVIVFVCLLVASTVLNFLLCLRLRKYETESSEETVTKKPEVTLKEERREIVVLRESVLLTKEYVNRLPGGIYEAFLEADKVAKRNLSERLNEYWRKDFVTNTVDLSTRLEYTLYLVDLREGANNVKREEHNLSV